MGKVKLSPKQKEVVKHLQLEEALKIHWIGGISPYCFMPMLNGMSFKLSTATVLKLENLGVIYRASESVSGSILKLTPLGQSIEL